MAYITHGSCICAELRCADGSQRKESYAERLLDRPRRFRAGASSTGSIEETRSAVIVQRVAKLKGRRNEIYSSTSWLAILTIVGTTAFGASLIIAAEKEWTRPPPRLRRRTPSEERRVSRGRQGGVRRTMHGLSRGQRQGDGKKVAEMKKEEKDRMKALTDPSITKQSDGELYWKISRGRSRCPRARSS